MFGGTAMLEVWEQGQHLNPTDRGLVALRAWRPDAIDESIAFDEFIHQLLLFRSETFGSNLEFYARCECGTAIEFEVSADALIQDAAQRRDDQGDDRLVASIDDFGEVSLTCAPPRVHDIASAAQSSDPARALLDACVVGISADSHTLTTDDLPDDLIGTVERWLDEHHPMLDIRLGVNCPECAASWTEVLDVPAHVWADIDVEVRSLLADVAVLARAYRWSERDLLQMSKQRREYYLESLA